MGIFTKDPEGQSTRSTRKRGTDGDAASKETEDEARPVTGEILAAETDARAKPTAGRNAGRGLSMEIRIVDEIDEADSILEDFPPPNRRLAEPPLDDPPPALDAAPLIESSTTIGAQTRITGDVASEGNLEILGAIEGAVRVSTHRVTIGSGGCVEGNVEAENVLVLGRITGDVRASDAITVEPGGIVGGDLVAPRVLMRDGAIVVGRIDMSASLPNPARPGARD